METNKDIQTWNVGRKYRIKANDCWEREPVEATLNNGVLTISGDGSMCDFSPNAPWSYTPIHTVVIEDNITYIGENTLSIRKLVCLYYSHNEEKFTSRIESGSLTFEGFISSLTFIDVGINNPNYSSEEGVLFNKDKTILIRYPSGREDKTYTIPDSVTQISEQAFEGCISLTSIIIPDSVTRIGRDTFKNCLGLIVNKQIPKQ